MDCHDSGDDLSLDPGANSNGHVVFGQFNPSLDVPFDQQVLGAAYITFDDHGFADGGCSVASSV